MSATLTKGMVRSAAALMLCLGGINTAQAQKPAGLPDNYPSRPVKVIVGASAGGGSDFLARFIAGQLSEAWGSSFTVENMPSGMGGILGAQFVSKAKPDGYVLSNISGSTFQALAFGTRVDVNPRTAFVPIAQISTSASYLAFHPKAPFTTLKELIAYAKANPGKLNFAAGGVGGGNHLAASYFMEMADIEMKHIPYKGAGQSTIDAVAGRIPIIFASITALTPHVKAGRLRGIGNTARQRFATHPDVPTIAEQGLPGYEYMSWVGWVGPTGVPAPIVRALNAEINKVLSNPEVVKRLVDEGSSPNPGTPEQFRQNMLSALSTVENILKKTGIEIGSD